MLDALRAVGWRNRYVLPALRQAALRNAHIATQPDYMIVVEFWLWAIFFRFSGEYRALPPSKQSKLREQAFQASFHDYKNVHKEALFQLMRDITPEYGLRASPMAFAMFEQYIRPSFEHSTIEAQKLPPLHESFDLSVLRNVLSKVHPAFLGFAGVPRAADEDRQYNLKLVTQVAALGQAQLYAHLTGLLIPADTVLIDVEQIPDLVDVFVSYSREDIDIVADLVRELENAGVSAWYDKRIIPDTSQFDRVISDQIAAAKLVLTVWSPASVNSKWVRAESLAGFNSDKLLQVRAGICEIPTPFNIVQTTEIDDRDALRILVETIMKRTGLVVPRAGEHSKP